MSILDLLPFRKKRTELVKVEPQIIAPAKQRRAGARAYGGAIVDRLTSDWIAPGTSADSEIFGSLRILRNRSRAILRDYDFARAGARALVNNVVGRGVRLQMQVKMLRGEGKLATDINDAIETAFWDWGRAGNCDVTGRLSWADVQALAFRRIFEDGEILLRRINTERFGDSRYPFALEVIEADMLADDHNGEWQGREIRMGVEVDRWGRPAAYWLHPRHPGDYQFRGRVDQTRLVRIPAAEIKHIFVVDRPGQTRGVPWLAATIKRVRNTQGYEEAEVIAARVQACNMGFVISPEGDYAADDENPEDANLPTLNMEPGVLERLGPGEEITFNNPTRPAGNYEPFMRSQGRGFAAGIGVTYEELSGDYSQSNYASSRLGRSNTQDGHRVVQSWLIGQLHEGVFGQWLVEAVAGGARDLADFRAAPARY
ncbi:MAG: phage portal protein, partial [Amphiplicatus sp.]